MKDFVIREYTVETRKLKRGQKLRFCVLADLHGNIYGYRNERLLGAVKDRRPDAVLIPGDQVVRKNAPSLKTGLSVCRELRKIAPVYYSLGNHERDMIGLDERAPWEDSPSVRMFRKYVDALKREEIVVLDNQSERFFHGTDAVSVFGLTIPMGCYRRGMPEKLEKSYLKRVLPERNKGDLSVLLAHNPVYGDLYFDWGADLIISGHLHGGVIRLGKRTGVVSPQFRLFPPYSCGDFYRGEKVMIVSAGIGDHDMPLRINNPRELVSIRLLGVRDGDRC